MDEPTSPSSAETPGPSPAGADDGSPVRIVAWSSGTTRQLQGVDALRASLAEPDTRVWVDIATDDEDIVGEVAQLLELHPLITEDIAERNQRAKVEETDGTIHIVLFWIAYAGEVTELEVDLVLCRRGLLTVHSPGWDPLTLPQLRGDIGNILKRGPDFLLYAITDGIVDGYFPVLDALDDEIDALQDDVIQKPSTWTLERLFALKKELIGLRRAMSPAREIFAQLTNRDLELLNPAHVIYFRDVYDHLIRVTDELDNDRELVAGTLEVYLSTINNNLSTIMKRLTGVTVILAGIGAVAGVFGMSEATTAIANGEGGGFWLITGFIVMGAALTALVLRRIDWI
ncbi:MAG TPA: magnesium transporter CorA family protein [Candidatus Limnocylindrales bacterium]|jgi:magnesium transporter|nr:magnesium transporter CorA family protein [Candidatus Limnocylindrales bacterium]